MIVPTTPWTADHFIGGHPALDLTNTVYDRHDPPADNELLDAGRSLAAWLQSQDLIDAVRAADIEMIDGKALEAAWSVRDATFDALDAVAAGREPPSTAIGHLLRTAGSGFERPGLVWGTTPVNAAPAREFEAGDVPAMLAALALDALYRLPPERVRSCPRCGWLFVDTSRGGRRRWCSMSTCGNREKTTRHREAKQPCRPQIGNQHF